MYSILVWTSKGGTGKTTTVANVGPELARLGYNVLLVGFDPQGDLEATFGIEDDDPDVTRVEQLLASGDDPQAAAVEIPLEPVPQRWWRGRPPRPGRLRLLACSSELHGAMALVARRGYEDLDRIVSAFEDEVDVVLIDTQGALTPLSHTAARAADGVLFTQEPGFYEYRALQARLAELEDMRAQEGTAVGLLGVLFVRVDARSRQMREYRVHFSDPEAFGGEPLHVFQAHVRQQASVRDHPRLSQPTVIADPGSHVGVDYRAFARELTERLAQLATTTTAAKKAIA